MKCPTLNGPYCECFYVTETTLASFRCFSSNERYSMVTVPMCWDSAVVCPVWYWFIRNRRCCMFCCVTIGHWCALCCVVKCTTVALLCAMCVANGRILSMYCSTRAQIRRYNIDTCGPWSSQQPHQHLEVLKRKHAAGMPFVVSTRCMPCMV